MVISIMVKKNNSGITLDELASMVSRRFDEIEGKFDEIEGKYGNQR
ncbi:MAG: hypothetical protein AAB461_03490 [Patescibacteria group bacterium]